MKKLFALKSLFMALAFAGSMVSAQAQQDPQAALAQATQIISELSEEEQQALLEGDTSVAEAVLQRFGISFDDPAQVRTAVAAILRAAANAQGTQPTPQAVQNISTALTRAAVSMAREAGVPAARASNNVSQGLQQGARMLANQWNVPPAQYASAVAQAVTTVVAETAPPADAGLPPVVVDDPNLIVASPEQPQS